MISAVLGISDTSRLRSVCEFSYHGFPGVCGSSYTYRRRFTAMQSSLTTSSVILCTVKHSQNGKMAYHVCSWPMPGNHVLSWHDVAILILIDQPGTNGCHELSHNLYILFLRCTYMYMVRNKHWGVYVVTIL